MIPALTRYRAATSGPTLVQQAAAAYGLQASFVSPPTAGNTILLAVSAFTASTVTVPAGFTLRATQATTGFSAKVYFYTKTSDGTEQTGSVSWDAGHTYQSYAMQEWLGSITLGTTTGKYIAPASSSPQTFGPTDAPPSPTAVPSFFWVAWNSLTSGSLPAGWTYTQYTGGSYGNAGCGTEAAPNAAVSAALTYTGIPAKFFWANIWIS